MNAIAGYISDSSSEDGDACKFFSISDEFEGDTDEVPKKREGDETGNNSFWTKRSKYEPDPSWSGLVEIIRKPSDSATNSHQSTDSYNIASVSTSEDLVYTIPKVVSGLNISKKFAVHHYVKPALGNFLKSKNPSHLNHSFLACKATANQAKWNVPQYSHLLAVCSMNSSCYVFDALSDNVTLVRNFTAHMKAVKACTWLAHGRQILTGSYDFTARIHDVETGKELVVLDHESAVTSVSQHPHNDNLCLTGSMDLIQLWDRRTSTHMKEFVYSRRTGQVSDLVFDRDASTLFSCNQLVERDSADRSIIAWDLRSTAVLSNQIYQERYSCVRMKLHQLDNVFLVQTHGNYIAQFSTNCPYKMHTGKRFEGHQLKGYPSGFDISPDGSQVLSGSADGKLHIYDYRSAKCTQKISTPADVITDVCCHPVLPGTCAVTSWAGSVFVYK